jgi:hypothetical protein
MSVKDYVYTDFQEISYEDFYDMVWDDVSERIVSTDYVNQYEDFIGNITFDFFRKYQMENTLTIRTISRFIEIFFFNLFRFQPPNTDMGS